MASIESDQPYPLETDQAFWLLHVPLDERKGRQFDPTRTFGSILVDHLDPGKEDELTIRLLAQAEEIQTGVDVITVPVAKKDGTVSYLRKMHREQFATCFQLEPTEVDRSPEGPKPEQARLGQRILRIFREPTA